MQREEYVPKIGNSLKNVMHLLYTINIFKISNRMTKLLGIFNLKESSDHENSVFS